MYSKILVPLDGSETAERGLREAIALAGALKSHLVLLHVVDDYPIMVDVASAVNFEEMRRYLLKFGDDVLYKARKQASEAAVSTEGVLREVSTIRASQAIVEEASKQGCSLVVMGTHGRRGFNRLAMGSDAELVTREAPVPVLLVRHPDAKG